MSIVINTYILVDSWSSECL